MNDLTKNLLLWVVVAVVLMVVFQSFSPKSSGAGAQGASYSQFLDQVDSGNVQKVAFGGDMRGGTSQLTYTTRGGQSSTITAPFDRDLINVLRTKNVEIVQEEPSSGISLGAILMNFLPVILIIGFWLFIMRQMQGGGGGAKGAMSFGKSRAKLQGEDQIKVTFADVAGCDEAKEEVGELVDFLRDPSKFTKLGGKIPRGVLMVGRRVPARRFWPRPSPAKPRCRSSRSPVRTSWKCSSASAPAACVTCSSRPRSTRRASSSSTKSTPSAATVAPAWAAVTTSASRP